MSFAALEELQGVNQVKSAKYHAYFRTKRTARNTSQMAPPELRATYFTAISYCRLACQALSERIEIDSVSASSKEATDYIQDFLKKIGGSDFVNSAHIAAMEYDRAYLVPTGSDRSDGTPGVQVVPGRDMVHAVDPFTGEVTEALRVYGFFREKRAYYTAEATYYLSNSAAKGWEIVETVPTTDGEIAVFPLLCRGEVNNTFGRPEAKDAFGLQDAACRVATDMSIASGTMATPQSVLIGVEAEDFTKRNPDGTVVTDPATGKPVMSTAEELYMSRILTIADSTAKVAEFTAAQLQNFSTALNSFTKMAAAILGVPQSIFGVSSDANPESGDAMRQDDARLIRRSEQLIRGFDPAWVGLFENILTAEGFENQTVKNRWVDPSLPNLASLADSIIKLAQVTVNGQPLYDWEELRQKLGDSQEDIDAAKERRERELITGLITGASNAQSTAGTSTPGVVPPGDSAGGQRGS